MKKLLIVGAGGLGRETYQWASDLQKIDKRWESIGFLDDNLNALDYCNLSDRIVGTISDYEPKEDEEVVCAFGDSELMGKIGYSLLEKGATFANVIHPTALLSENCQIGVGVIVGPYSVISTNVKIGDFVIINSLNTIGHDASIEKGCVISAHCDLMGFAYMEEGAFLGSGARVFPSVRVCKNAKVGAGSVVIRKVKADTSVFGNPAKAIFSSKS